MGPMGPQRIGKPSESGDCEGTRKVISGFSEPLIRPSAISATESWANHSWRLQWEGGELKPPTVQFCTTQKLYYSNTYPFSMNRLDRKSKCKTAGAEKNTISSFFATTRCGTEKPVIPQARDNNVSVSNPPKLCHPSVSSCSLRYDNGTAQSTHSLVLSVALPHKYKGRGTPVWWSTDHTDFPQTH